MRLKTLTKYNFSTIRNAIIVFFLCYVFATLLGSVLNNVLGNDSVVMGVSEYSNGIRTTWSSGIVAFSIFMLVSSLIGSQKDTRFLITRSVSRKEIYAANVIFLCPLAAIMGALQVMSICIDSFVRWCFGEDWHGLGRDIQILQAPDMDNVLVFFLVTFSILLAFGAISYLFGSLLARWKIQTIIAVCILFVLFLALIGSTDLAKRITSAFKYMFTDKNTGLIIALKQIAFSAVVLAISFPVMRRITAARQ